MSVHHWDALWLNAQLATMTDGGNGGYGEISDGALAVKDGVIAWVGKQSDLPTNYQTLTIHDANGAWITPALIDCHTHIVYAGNRSNEFEARLNGATYAHIAEQGGGILSTVRATRMAGEDELFNLSLPRVRRLMSEGVGVIEIKSGYGLDLDTEAKMLRVARRIGETLPITVKTTFLGAHALPPEFSDNADGYIEHVCDVMLPSLFQAGLVDAVDAFCEHIAFSPIQTERVFARARALGLPVKLHAEQLSDQGGVSLVAQYGGLSADHLEYLSPAGIAAMQRANTVATLLPSAFYFLRETKLPPIGALRTAGVPMAVATDCNPGTSPLTSLLMAMNMACTLFKLTPAEALAGTTRHAAQALGLAQSQGQLHVGMRADFALWDITRPADLSYAMGANPCVGLVLGGLDVERGD